MNGIEEILGAKTEESSYFSVTKKEKKQLKVGKWISLAITGALGVLGLISYSKGDNLSGVYGLSSICSAYVSILFGSTEYGVNHPEKYDSQGNLKTTYFSKRKIKE